MDAFVCEHSVLYCEMYIVLLDSLSRDTTAQLLLKENFLQLTASICCQVLQSKNITSLQSYIRAI